MMNVHLAFDATTTSEWTSHYAMRMAARSTPAALTVHYVQDGGVDQANLDKKLARIRERCRRAGVECRNSVEVCRGTVANTLLTSVPAGPEALLVCGARRSGVRGWLAGSISQELLRSQHCNVLSIRVNEPGILGLPRRLLLPISGHPRGFCSGLPFLRLMRPDLTQLHLLHVKQVGQWQFRRLTPAQASSLRQAGEAYCQRIEQELDETLDLNGVTVDSQAVVSDDVPKEIVIAANRTKSRLILLGATERNLPQRLFWGNPLEQVLRDATCDVAIYRGVP